jgi:predicted Rossmann-fold nucleotide-binding protein
VSLPGGLGTLEELTEILSFRKLELHHRRVVLLNTLGFFEPLLEQIERAIAAGLEKPTHRDFYALTDDPQEAVRLCEAQLESPASGKRSAQRAKSERRRRSPG